MEDLESSDRPPITADDLIEGVLWLVLIACLVFVLCLSAGYAVHHWNLLS